MRSVLPIESLDDPRVRGFRNVRDRELRGQDGLFVVESPKVVARLVGSRFETSSVLVSPRRHLDLKATLDRLDPEVPIYEAPEPLVHEISGYHVHGGALALARRPAPWATRPDTVLSPVLARPTATLLVAAGVTHLDNVGALFRIGAGFGVDAILLDDRCCDPLLRKAVRVAMGHVLTTPYAIDPDLPGTLGRLLRDHDVETVALETGEGDDVDSVHPLPAMPRSARLALVVGSEGHGMPEAVLRACRHVCEIPMAAGVPSLNVAVAAAVALYERRRGRAD